jgi:hypothetical protein
MKLKASIVEPDGSWSSGPSNRLLVVHQPPRKGEWVELEDRDWYEVVNVVHICYGFNVDGMDERTAERTAELRLAPYGDKLGSVEDLPTMSTVDVIILLRPIKAPHPIPG